MASTLEDTMGEEVKVTDESLRSNVKRLHSSSIQHGATTSLTERTHEFGWNEIRPSRVCIEMMLDEPFTT
jgi:plasmid replication initiation protein